METKQPSIVQFPRKGAFLHKSIFLFVDLQKEYLASGRAYALKEIETCLNNNLILLEFARDQGMKIVHFAELWTVLFSTKKPNFQIGSMDFNRA